jgi:hypothetical protein
MRLNILLCILVLGVAAMAYDRMVARPAVEAAYAAIVAKNVEVNATRGQVFTNTDVQKLIGKTPAKTFTNPDGDTVEIYQWRAGLPIRTHDLYAIYTQMDGKQLFQEGGTGDYEKIMQEAGASSRKSKVVTLTEEDIKAMSQADREANQGGGDAGMESNAAQEAREQAEEERGSSQEENTAAEDTAAEDSATEDSATEDEAAKDSATEDGAAEDTATEDTATEDTATEDTATEDTATEESAAPAAKAPASSDEPQAASDQ